MSTLEQQLRTLREKESKLLEQLKEENKKKTIGCASCDNQHEIGRLTAIQTHYYDRAYDASSQGELRFVCPETRVENRILFDIDDNYRQSPLEQFKNTYKSLFKQVIHRQIDNCDNTQGDWEEKHAKTVNNYYIDKNPELFGLDVKKKCDCCGNIA
ncbi:hypothetical protein COT72_01000 [archaeon CG10_big_fil_rev_8_21_14_0_10_43_11]|nr:MAG: hypothetical protein COT72_01000 [archaeon CG10_big_fil_rev_8_21_14_0_10_43_11]